MYARIAYIPVNRGAVKLTKDKYIFELIDQCMLITCQNNILVENFELRDDKEYYVKNEEQFYSCLCFYDKMEALRKEKKIDEAVMDQELKTILALIRQRAIKQLLKDFKIYLDHTSISDTAHEIDLLKTELQKENIDSQYLLKKIKEFRNLELNQ